MSFLKCRSFKVINKPERPGSIHKKVKNTKPQIIKETKLKRSKRCDIYIYIYKTPTLTLTSGPTVESDYPPLHNIQLTYKDQTVDTAPYKLPGEDTLTNTKHIIQQNNFTNTNLHTIGKQLTILEKQMQKNPVHFMTDKNPIDLKLKNPVFKPYQVTKTSQAQIQENQTDFLRAIKTHLQNLDRTTLTVPDTPQQSNPSSSTNQVNTLQNNPASTSDTDAFQEQPLQLNRLT